MNHIKNIPVGIDVTIQDMQIELYDALSESWGDINGFGRVYKQDKQERIIPEYYVGNSEYKEVLTNDSFVGTFFFIEDDEIISTSLCLSRNRVDLYVLVDAAKAREDVDHYPDEEIRLQVLRIARRHFTEVVRTTKGKEAMKSFTTHDLDFIHPYFIFKITGIINNY